MSGIFNAAIFNNAIFNTGTAVVVDDVVKTGTGGIDPGGAGYKRRTIVKPTGLAARKDGRKEVEDRIDESREIQAEIAGRLAREFAEETQALEGEILKARALEEQELLEALEAKRIQDMTAAEVSEEIGILLRKKIRQEEEELLLMLMIAASE